MGEGLIPYEVDGISHSAMITLEEPREAVFHVTWWDEDETWNITRLRVDWGNTRWSATVDCADGSRHHTLALGNWKSAWVEELVDEVWHTIFMKMKTTEAAQRIAKISAGLNERLSNE